jgi:hypothetical protein
MPVQGELGDPRDEALLVPVASAPTDADAFGLSSDLARNREVA